MSEKLPVFATFKEAAVVFLRYGGRVGLGLTIVALLGAIGQILFVNFFGFSIDPSIGHPPDPKAALLSMAGTLVFYAALLPFITSYQRLVIQGAQARVEFMYRREEWMVLGAFLRIVLIYFGGAFVIFLPLVILAVALGKPIGIIVAGVLGVPLFLTFIILLNRLTLLVVAAANGDAYSLRQGFDIGKGNTWRLLGVLFLPMIPVLLIELIFVKLLLIVPVQILTGVFLPFTVVVMLYQSGVWALIYARLKPAASQAEDLERKEPFLGDEGTGEDVAP